MAEIKQDTNAANWTKLCEWMEPKPERFAWIPCPPPQWWAPDYVDGVWVWTPRAQTLDACALAEAEIEKRGLIWKYRTACMSLWGESTDGEDELLFLIRLAPAQRCAAMVAVIEANHA
jgi:hypothetical protein